uniref:Uncharacterized protein n=1 Tax=uncultured bacterium contig00109 TaxID=1181574 RepID=A0A806K1W7_9BACT|nr:hypothetical protein [uncultured bacterium contig00109]
MTALRKIVDSDDLTTIFDLPPAFKNRKVEVILFPVEESSDKKTDFVNDNLPLLTMAQIEEWAKTPEIQTLVGVLKGTGLSEDISINDIRNERLAEKYRI